MSGETEEPFRLDVQVDSVHSGSISFGRFENEALCWERRSSFSHNRYIEEVEKCSKPGSVIEKKAYFEAHFRKKGFLGLNSPGCRNEIERNTGNDDILEKMDNEEIGHMNGVAQYDSYEETEVLGTLFSESHVELASDSNDSDCITKHVKAVDADDVEYGSSLSIDSKSGIKMKDNLNDKSGSVDNGNVSNVGIDKFPDDDENEKQPNPSLKDAQGLSPKESTPSGAEYMKPRLIAVDRVEQRRRNTSSNASKVAEKKANKTVSVRSKAEKPSLAPKELPLHETSKYKFGSKTKDIDEFRRAEKQSTNRIVVGPRPSTSEKISNRVHQHANRVSPAVGANKSCMRQDNPRFSFKSDERAQRRKEFDMKLEEKNHAKEAKMHQIQTMTREKKNAEIQQLRKSLNFKAIPMPPFSRRASLVPDGNKVMASNNKPPKQVSKSSTPGIRAFKNSTLNTKAGKEWPISRDARPRTTDPPQASATSCHSTVTSDSSASSHTGTSNRHPSGAGISLVGKKKELEKDKLASFRRNKLPEVKGKTFSGNQSLRS